jgi:hypothetical protein
MLTLRNSQLTVTVRFNWNSSRIKTEIIARNKNKGLIQLLSHMANQRSNDITYYVKSQATLCWSRFQACALVVGALSLLLVVVGIPFSSSVTDHEHTSSDENRWKIYRSLAEISYANFPVPPEYFSHGAKSPGFCAH